MAVRSDLKAGLKST